MLNNFRNLESLFGSHGSRWLLFRVAYALRKRTGYIRLQMPQYQWQDRPLATWLKKGVPSSPQPYFQWRKQKSPPSGAERSGSADEARFLENPPWNPQTALDEAQRIVSGELKYFSHAYYQVGFPPDWHTDPVSGFKLDSHQHWADLSDDPDVDIKFIWEASRFGMVYPLVRAYGFTRDERFVEAFWRLVHSWAESNPPNTGPNWMDGQEAALRLLAWTFGLDAFRDSPATTPERLAELVVMIAAHAERIDKNLGYAISTHSNHTISEAFGLWLVGLRFPELKAAERYFVLGRKLLEQEAAVQIFPDGSYSMYAINYHRFTLHLYLYAMRLAALNDAPFSPTVHERVSQSIDYLAQLIDADTGKMPVYGSNDGALVLPLNSCDFTDYRPLLQLGSYITKKQFLFEPGPWDEDIFWLCGAPSLTSREMATARQLSSFPNGGTYLLRGAHSKAILRCMNPRSRPSHADQLHMDLWIHGQNLAIDPGTYLYSGPGPWRNGLAHTAVHNTVSVDGQDQMKMLTRFTWTNWSHGQVLRNEETLWQAAHDGYRRLADPVDHRRTVMSFPDDRWLVVDHLTARKPHHYALHWLLADGEYEIQELAPAFGLGLRPSSGRPFNSKLLIQLGVLEDRGEFSLVRADPHSTRGWRSQYYGEKEPALSIVLEAGQSSACFWSYFGLQEDEIKLMGRALEIRGGAWNTQVNVDLL